MTDQVAVTENFDQFKQDDQTLAHDQQKSSINLDYSSEFAYWEKKYQDLCHEISNSYSDDGDDEDSEDSEDDDFCEQQTLVLRKPSPVSEKNTDPTLLRQKIYRTIHSSLDFKECAQKLELLLKSGQEKELCQMFLDCCLEMTYQNYLGSLAKRFCDINPTYAQHFEEMFKTSYSTIDCLDASQAHSVSKFFAHLLMTDSISWRVLANLKLDIIDVTSSVGVFEKTLLVELSDNIRLSVMKQEFQCNELKNEFTEITTMGNSTENKVN